MKNKILSSTLLGDLVKYTNLPPYVVLKKCKTASKILASIWKERKSNIEFYTNNELYIFDLTMYQLMLEYDDCINKMILQIKEYGWKKILEFWWWIWEFSRLCNQNWINSTYYDLDWKIKEYALWRFNNHKCDDIIIWGGWVLDQKWDFINIMDVLEHLEKPEPIIEKLKQNTKYIFCNPVEIKYNSTFPQHISKYDIEKYFVHTSGHLWKNRWL